MSTTRAARRVDAGAFLRSFERLVTERMRGLRVFLKTTPKEEVPTGRLALERGFMRYEAQAR